MMSPYPIRRRRRQALAVTAVTAVLLGASLGPLAAQDNAAPPAPAATPDAAAAPAVDPNAVVATVNGETITEGDLQIAAQDFGQDLQQMPEDQRRSALIDAVIDMRLMAKAATDAGLDQTDEFRRRLDQLRLRALRNEYFTAKIDALVTDDMVRARYNEEVAKLNAPEEVHARHILVDSEAEANAIIQDLNNGADFAEEAKAKSTDQGSAPQGGDLGFFAKGRMIPEFEQAAFALQPGQITEAPVHSQFGWHIIKVEERRMQPPPPYEVVGGQLRRLLLQEAYIAEVGKLREGAQIQVTGQEAEPAPAEQAPAEAAPAAPAAPATPAPAAPAEPVPDVH